MTSKLKGYREIDPWQLDENVFQRVGKDFFEIVVGNPETGANAMTAAWGGMGVMWNMPVLFTVVRGEEYRHSRKMLDNEPLFSACWLGADKGEAKGYLGRVHGWDVADKITEAGLETGWCGTEIEHNPASGIGEHLHAPIIEGSEIVLICEKIAAQELEIENIFNPEIIEKHYTREGKHCIYISEIRAAFIKE